jgi:hypothetical protein
VLQELPLRNADNRDRCAVDRIRALELDLRRKPLLADVKLAHEGYPGRGSDLGRPQVRDTVLFFLGDQHNGRHRLVQPRMPGHLSVRHADNGERNAGDGIPVLRLDLHRKPLLARLQLPDNGHPGRRTVLGGRELRRAAILLLGDGGVRRIGLLRLLVQQRADPVLLQLHVRHIDTGLRLPLIRILVRLVDVQPRRGVLRERVKRPRHCGLGDDRGVR